LLPSGKAAILKDSGIHMNRGTAVELIFGLDIGTTSIGFAVIEHDHKASAGKILRLGVRIFPEARDPKGVPWNQERRAARLRRRQLRRRRQRRGLLAEQLQMAGLLPERNSGEWRKVMKEDPYQLRRRAFDKEELTPYEVGRAIYHLAQRRHFRGRDIDEVSDDAAEAEGAVDADEKVAQGDRETTIQALKSEGSSLGAWLAKKGEGERRRGIHASRAVVEKEFDDVWAHHLPEQAKESVREAIFFQRPVFWRLNTLGRCRFVPDASLCPKGSWLSQQRRMLEKVNNLSVAGGNQRPLDSEEREAILSQLQIQASMTWAGVRRVLAPVFRNRGEPGAEKSLKFNLEIGGEQKLMGNAVEAKLAKIFGAAWQTHPRKQEVRDAVHDLVWRSHYEKVGEQRVVIRRASERNDGKNETVRRLIEEFGLSEGEAEQVASLKLPTGWEPYSVQALNAMLPHLERGARFGEIINGPDWKDWRNENFPDREQPTGEVFDRLPSSANPDERKRIANLRNPTVARSRNELRKVVNNLVSMFGKPDLIRIELSRDVGLSKREREDKAAGIRRNEGLRKSAHRSLCENGITNPSRTDIEKWMLWKECGGQCPYSGDMISFDGLFRSGDFEVEHIWPRSRSLDDSFRNKTLCRKDMNARKGNRTPFEYLMHQDEEWQAIGIRLAGMMRKRGGPGMSAGKVKRFLAKEIPDGFVERQLNDTGYAAREASSYLRMLWPDLGPEASVKVFAVSGRVTAHLRRLWGLNGLLSDEDRKTRDDHRHHAIDALAVACCHPGITQRLSRYWQAKDEQDVERPSLALPWASIRADAEMAVSDIVVSHRVRKKVSGPLHKETVYGDTSVEDSDGRGHTFRYFVTRKKVENLSRKELTEGIRDEDVRLIVAEWVEQHGGDPKKAFPPYPMRGRKGPEIRKVRILVKQQVELMAPVSTGYADLGNNHHIAIYRKPDGSVDFEVVSLFEASRRLRQCESVVRHDRGDGSDFLMSISPGDSLEMRCDGQVKIMVVKGVWASGVIVMVEHTDATVKGDSVYRPNAKSILASGGRKISVDPIGRIRPASD